MTMVEDWKRAYRWFSVQALFILAALPPAWLLVPEKYQDLIPAEYQVAIPVLLALGGIAGRLIDQKPVG